MCVSGGGGGGGGEGTLIFSYIYIRRFGPFLGVQNLEFQYFFLGGGSEISLFFFFGGGGV